MRERTILICVVIVLVVLLYAAHDQASGQTQGRIRVTATLEATRTSNGASVREYLLWNTAVTSEPIGHAFSSCQRAPGSVSICTSVYTLPLGRIIVVSEAHSFRRHTGVITGGSRSRRATAEGRPGYVGVEGVLVITRIGPGTYSLNFLLQ